MQSAREYFNYLNHAYAAVHKAKEDLFWTTYMATSDDQAAFVRAEAAYKEFVGDPAKLTRTRQELALVRAAPAGAKRDALLLVRAGEKGDKPVVMSRGGKSYNAFLEGRVKGDSYCLILHLSNMELKRPKEITNGDGGE